MTPDDALLGHFLDSLKDPFVFCDLEHVIRYWNVAAQAHYAGRGTGIGHSVLDCHNADSCAQILEISTRFAAEPELDEVLITDNDRHRIWMRAVRDGEGTLLGYYERYAPPLGA
jgi:PAS domain-containing protein